MTYIKILFNFLYFFFNYYNRPIIDAHNRCVRTIIANQRVTSAVPPRYPRGTSAVPPRYLRDRGTDARHTFTDDRIVFWNGIHLKSSDRLCTHRGGTAEVPRGYRGGTAEVIGRTIRAKISKERRCLTTNCGEKFQSEGRKKPKNRNCAFLYV